MTGKLQDVRAAIDQIDDELLDLICRRMALSAEVAKVKSGAVTYRPGREAEVFTRLAARVPDLPAGITRNIWLSLFRCTFAVPGWMLKQGPIRPCGSLHLTSIPLRSIFWRMRGSWCSWLKNLPTPKSVKNTCTQKWLFF